MNPESFIRKYKKYLKQDADPESVVTSTDTIRFITPITQ